MVCLLATQGRRETHAGREKKSHSLSFYTKHLPPQLARTALFACSVPRTSSNAIATQFSLKELAQLCKMNEICTSLCEQASNFVKENASTGSPRSLAAGSLAGFVDLGHVRRVVGVADRDDEFARDEVGRVRVAEPQARVRHGVLIAAGHRRLRNKTLSPPCWFVAARRRRALNSREMAPR